MLKTHYISNISIGSYNCNKNDNENSSCTNDDDNNDEEDNNYDADNYHDYI